MSGGSREERNRDKGRREKTAHLDVKQPMGLCCKDHHSEEGMTPIHDYSMYILTTCKNPAFDFINGEIILRFSLFLGFTCGISLKNN